MTFRYIEEKVDLCKLLLEEGANIHEDNDLVLSLSIDYYSPLVTQLLLEKGADINVITKTWNVRYLVKHLKAYICFFLPGKQVNNHKQNKSYSAAEKLLIQLIYLIKTEDLKFVDQMFLKFTTK
jgi:hypothetical protein